MTKEKLIKKFNDENNPELKEFYIKQILKDKIIVKCLININKFNLRLINNKYYFSFGTTDFLEYKVFKNDILKITIIKII